MIRTKQANYIRRLAEEGFSQREISFRSGVARKTVAAILSGEPRPELAFCDSVYDIDNPVFTAPPSRCPKCGAVVWQPCLACSLPEQKLVVEDKCNPMKRPRIREVDRRRRKGPRP